MPSLLKKMTTRVVWESVKAKRTNQKVTKKKSRMKRTAKEDWQPRRQTPVSRHDGGLALTARKHVGIQRVLKRSLTRAGRHVTRSRHRHYHRAKVARYVFDFLFYFTLCVSVCVCVGLRSRTPPFLLYSFLKYGGQSWSPTFRRRPASSFTDVDSITAPITVGSDKALGHNRRSKAAPRLGFDAIGFSWPLAFSSIPWWSSSNWRPSTTRERTANVPITDRIPIASRFLFYSPSIPLCPSWSFPPTDRSIIFDFFRIAK